MSLHYPAGVLQIRVIQLSDEQKKIVLCLRKLYLQNLGILVRRRQDLSSMLQVGPRAAGAQRRFILLAASDLGCALQMHGHGSHSIT